MADRSVDALLVGGGVAGASCAVALRDGGFAGSVLLVGRELDAPYERPPVSKEYLRGERRKAALALALPPDVEVLTRTSVTKLDLEARVARLSSKEEVAFERVLVATGANVRRLPVDGAQLDGIHYLRAPMNADAIRRDAETLAPSTDVVVVGGSYLGTEVAAALTEMGLRVTVVMQEAVALERHYGPTAGGWLQALLAQRGVRFVGDVALAGFDAAGEGGERVGAVRLSDGAVLEAALVVVAAGAVPDVMLAKGSGLPIGETGGVRCDAALRVVGVEGAWAAGDVCEWESALHGGPARVEHWEVAAAQGRAVAAGMLGASAPFAEVPYFWSDLADWATSEYVGVAGLGGWDEEVVRGAPAAGAFSVWQLRGGRLVGALSVGRPGDLDHARRIIARGGDVDRAALADAGADLATA